MQKGTNERWGGQYTTASRTMPWASIAVMVPLPNTHSHHRSLGRLPQTLRTSQQRRAASRVWHRSKPCCRAPSARSQDLHPWTSSHTQVRPSIESVRIAIHFYYNGQDAQHEASLALAADLEVLRAQRGPGLEGEAARGVAPSNKRYIILTHASGPVCAHYPLPLACTQAPDMVHSASKCLDSACRVSCSPPRHAPLILDSLAHVQD